MTTSFKSYIYEAVLFDNGDVGGASPIVAGDSYDKIDLSGMRLIGNHDYPLRANNVQTGPIIGEANMFVKDGKLLGNLKSLKPLLGLTPNIGFAINEWVEENGKKTVTDSTLYYVSVGGGPNLDESIPKIGEPTRVEEEIMDTPVPGSDAAL